MVHVHKIDNVYYLHFIHKLLVIVYHVYQIVKYVILQHNVIYVYLIII
jgi:hypothetical protein